MKLEKVENQQISFARSISQENSSPYEVISDTTIAIGVLGLLVETHTNINAGEFANSIFLASILFGIIASSLPKFPDNLN